jgi:hypothetical protein
MDLKDLLPLFNAVFITDVFFMLLLNIGIINSKVLKDWYKTYNLSAVIADVFIIVIVLLITKKIYYYIFKEYLLIKFIILALIIQIVHDILFFILITIIPKGSNRMIDTFKDYAKEISYKAIIGDSLMIIMSCILLNYFEKMNKNINIIILIITMYIMPYILNN